MDTSSGEIAIAAAGPELAHTNSTDRTMLRSARPTPRRTRGGGLPMPAITDRRAARLTVTLVIAALLVSGCVSVSRTAEPTAQSAPTTSTTPAATATASGPMTDKEVVWVNQITKLRHAISETISPSSSTDLTREELARWENAMRGCSRTLARIGSPSAHLQPVYALVK